MPHPQSAVLRDQQRIHRARKRPQPTKMDEFLDGDRLLELLDQYIRTGSSERIAALLTIVQGVEMSFSSRPKQSRFAQLCKRHAHHRTPRRTTAAA